MWTIQNRGTSTVGALSRTDRNSEIAGPDLVGGSVARADFRVEGALDQAALVAVMSDQRGDPLAQIAAEVPRDGPVIGVVQQPCVKLPCSAVKLTGLWTRLRRATKH